MKNFALAAVSALALTAAAAPASAGTVRSAVSAVVNAGGTNTATSIVDTYNQNGLSSRYTSGVTDFDAYLATNPLHTINYATAEWFGQDSTGVITYDLGQVYTLSAMALWNEETYGMTAVTLLGSADGVTFTALGSYRPIDNPVADYPAQRLNFAAAQARYVRLDMTACGLVCSIGEVAFNAAPVTAAGVPEPATWGLMLAGFGMVGAGARLRRRSTGVTYA